MWYVAVCARVRNHDRVSGIRNKNIEKGETPPKSFDLDLFRILRPNRLLKLYHLQNQYQHSDSIFIHSSLRFLPI